MTTNANHITIATTFDQGSTLSQLEYSFTFHRRVNSSVCTGLLRKQKLLSGNTGVSFLYPPKGRVTVYRMAFVLELPIRILVFKCQRMT